MSRVIDKHRVGGTIYPFMLARFPMLSPSLNTRTARWRELTPPNPLLPLPESPGQPCPPLEEPAPRSNASGAAVGQPQESPDGGGGDASGTPMTWPPAGQPK
jgi:hypothetical protein